ncbi:hypothetical protein AKJ09_04946 [Labilithrix luteola]|uniref:Uncharacterized protein n=1 Tax=Labilithrix luteola TaxID=1391654 RepID=A0A0K1PXP9_9BACT|nr:hypothetical protein AKJ09_04946 [Labilithrix luteola]
MRPGKSRENGKGFAAPEEKRTPRILSRPRAPHRRPLLGKPQPERRRTVRAEECRSRHGSGRGTSSS